MKPHKAAEATCMCECVSVVDIDSHVYAYSQTQADRQTDRQTDSCNERVLHAALLQDSVAYVRILYA